MKNGDVACWSSKIPCSATTNSLFGGADQAIPPTSVATFDAALTAAGVEHRVVSYPDAPHSFFDRKADEFARSSEAAWAEVLGFIRSRTAQVARR